MKNDTTELLALLKRATAYIHEHGSFGPPGGPEFLPDMSDPQTRLSLEIQEAIRRISA
jgi:hypothetical protein